MNKNKNVKHKIFILSMIISSILLFSLGCWQVQRLEQKTERITNLEENITKAAVNFPFKSSGEVEEFQRLRVRGKYLHSQEIYITKYNEKKKLGYHVVTPLLMDDDTVILTNRGWMPKEQDQKKKGQEKVTAEGIVRVGDKVRWYSPNNQPEKNFWFLADVEDMLKYFRKNNDKTIHPIFLQITKDSNLDEYPKKLPTQFKIRNDHLKYAFIWFSLSLATLIMSFVYARSELKGRKNRKK